MENFKKSVYHYFSVYAGFLSTCFTQATSFRVNFVLLVTMDLFFYFTSFATVSFIFDHVETIGPWQRPQLMFFIAYMLTLDQLHMTLISESFWVFSRELKTGALDYVILKPINTVFNVFFRHIRPSTVVNAVVTWSALGYYGYHAGLVWSDWPLVPPLLVLSFTLLVLIEFIVASSMFWLTEGLGINFLRMQMQQLGRWPDYIYARAPRRLLTFVLPILLVGSPPVHFLLDKGHWPYLLGMMAAIVGAAFVLSFVWKKGLRQYESASS